MRGVGLFTTRLRRLTVRASVALILECALSFLTLIGVMLVAESTGQHVGKGYIYAAMAFSGAR